MKIPIHQHAGTIYDASGALVATCANEAVAALIVERVNTWQAQYAAGHAAGTNETNARRDHEMVRRVAQAERRGYDRACEEQLWGENTAISLVA